MNGPNAALHIPDDFDDLLAELWDGSPTAERSRRLQTLVIENDACLERFFAAAQLHGALAWDRGVSRRAKASAPAEAVAESLPSRAMAARTETASTPPSDCPADSAAAPAMPAIGIVRRILGPRIDPWKFAAVTAALTVAVWAMFLYVILPPLGGKRAPVATNVEATAPIRAARLVRTHDCQWGGGYEAAAGRSFYRNDRLYLRSGLAEIEFGDGALVIIEGPTAIRFEGAKGAFLAQGKLAARVPVQAQGFTITTPAVEVVDLGTEFGVAADKREETEVQVYSGRVSLQSTGPDGEACEPIIISAGEGKRITRDRASGEVETRDLDGARQEIVRRLPDRETWRIEYPPTLVGYWSCESYQGWLLDRRGKNHGALEGARNVPGLIGRDAVRFGGAENGEAARITRLPLRTAALSASSAVSIETLLVSSWSGRRGSCQHVARLALEEGRAARQLAISLRNDGAAGASGPALDFRVLTANELYVVSLPLDGRDGRPALADIANAAPHHVVAAFDAERGVMVLYVDGVLQAGGALGADVPRRNSNEWTSDAVASEPFVGILDEVAVYREALSAEEIARHWDNVNQGRTYFDVEK